jgi:hypothetical protein
VLYYDFDEASGSPLDYSGNGLTGTNSGADRVTTIGTNQAMYYDASGTDYIRTNSFAIPDTGVLTIEAWMKSKINATIYQTIVGDGVSSTTVGFIFMRREISSDNLSYRYADGTASQLTQFTNLFQNLDNQWIHIVVVCDYNNKTIKAYKDGALFGTNILSGTPVFPSANRAKYIGSYSTQWYLTDGSLDEVRIYNRGLSVEEISAQYTSTKGKFGL